MTSLFTSLETNWKLTTYSVIVSLLRFQIKVESMNKMTNATVETVYFQDEIPVILNTSLALETHIKGHHVYMEVWTPEVREKLNVLMKPNNRVDKFAVCVKKDQAVVGYLKKGDSGKFAKTIFYFLRSDIYCNCYAEISGKRCNLKDGEGLQVPWKIIITGQKEYVNMLKHELQKTSDN